MLTAEMSFHCCLAVWTLQKPRWVRDLFPFWSCRLNMTNAISAGALTAGRGRSWGVPADQRSTTEGTYHPHSFSAGIGRRGRGES